MQQDVAPNARPSPFSWRAAGWPLAATAAVFLVLAWSGALAAGAAAAGCATIALSLLFLRRQPVPRPPLETPSAPEAKASDLLQPLIDALPQAALAVDGGEHVLAFNAPAGRLAPSLRRGDPLSFSLRTPALLQAVRRAVTTGKPQRVDDTATGPTEHWYALHIAPVVQETSPGRAIVLLVFEDLTALRRSEAMRADFVANASHELRTPLAALSGFIETLQGPARDDAAARARFLGIMQAQAGRMARLIDDLLSLSRIEFAAHSPPQDRIDLVAIVRQVVDALQTLARDRSVEIVLRVPERSVSVRGDRDELLRVFENLLENALKYAASGKRVEITLTLDEGPPREARVGIRDFGPGIAPAHLPRLTERFYRVDVVQSRAEGGTGLGLALVKHILVRHGGRLSISSVPGAGAQFVAHIPLVDTTAPDHERES